MNRRIVQNQQLIFSALIIALGILLLPGCTTVRDTMDWVPGVSSNEEIQAEEQKQAQAQRQLEQQHYEEQAIYAPTDVSGAAQRDAQINVVISEQYAQNENIKREDIGIEVNAGVVTLTGNVNSNQSAIRAIAIARDTRGVSRVISKLVVIELRTK